MYNLAKLRMVCDFTRKPTANQTALTKDRQIDRHTDGHGETVRVLIKVR